MTYFGNIYFINTNLSKDNKQIKNILFILLKMITIVY